MLLNRIAMRLVPLLIAMLPIMTLSSIGNVSAAAFLLVFSAAYLCVSKFELNDAKYYFSQYGYLVLALFSSSLIILISSAFHGKFSGPDLERSLRLAAGVALLLGACLKLEIDTLKQSIWGFMLSVWVAAGYVFWLFLQNTSVRPELSFIHNALTYGNLLMLMTVLSAFSTLWKLTKSPKLEAGFKLLTTAVGLLSVAITETRTAWVTLPVFLFIGGLIFYRQLNSKKSIISLCLGLVVITGVFLSNSTFHERIKSGARETMECLSVNTVAWTSDCIRLQLWRTSWIMFKENPLLGSGSTANFPKKLKELATVGVVSPRVAEEFGEAHSESMQTLAAYGFFGFLALLLAYFAPAYIFLRRIMTRGSPQSVKVSAAMGLAVSTGFFMFGITELMFRAMHVVSFYAVMIAWLLAISDPQKNNLLHRKC
ncbi:O-antigen ligase family protein [Zwartia vadi]|uniref:O-antigen ligase family protein n=1 Tax=Zwartia vadi TaxID=3058168 RepID=UPI0025B548E5|nr:O-antigen ligase family protein [Zwartia vadi]MDN3988214.1 O-antigen ligase family protein [Zwartia vadi]